MDATVLLAKKARKVSSLSSTQSSSGSRVSDLVRDAPELEQGMTVVGRKGGALTRRREQGDEYVEEDDDRRDRPCIIQDQPKGISRLEFVVVVKVRRAVEEPFVLATSERLLREPSMGAVSAAMHLPENGLDERVDDSASRVPLLVRDVEASQGLSKPDRKNHEQDAEDGRFLQRPRTSVSRRQRHRHRQTAPPLACARPRFA